VNGPGLLRVSTRPAATTASTSVEKSSIDCAVCTMFGRGAVVVGVLVVVVDAFPGMSTLSITWITPLSALTSAVTTFAVTMPLSVTTDTPPSAATRTVTVAPFTVSIC